MDQDLSGQDDRQDDRRPEHRHRSEAEARASRGVRVRGVQAHGAPARVGETIQKLDTAVWFLHWSEAGQGMNLPNLKPPPMPPEEYLRRLYLQREGLASWEAGPEKSHMEIWLEAQIYKKQQEVNQVKGSRS